jgi:hypothetical protein
MFGRGLDFVIAVMGGIVAYGLFIGWFGGLTVMGVELMEAMCQSSWSLSTRVWILVGSMTFLSIVVLYTGIGYVISILTQ